MTVVAICPVLQMAGIRAAIYLEKTIKDISSC
jgi:hypothetical protein